jgi:hypothetical protein
MRRCLARASSVIVFGAWSWLLLAYFRTMHLGLLSGLRREWFIIASGIVPVGLLALWFVRRNASPPLALPSRLHGSRRLPLSRPAACLVAVLLLALAASELGASLEEAKFRALVEARRSPTVHEARPRWPFSGHHLVCHRFQGGREIIHAAD